MREMHCAAAMCRDFHWPDVNLWASELPRGAVVSLGGRDNMIPVAEIHKLLSASAVEAKGVKVIYEAERAHGAFLLSGELQERILMAGCPVPAADDAIATVAAMVAAELPAQQTSNLMYSELLPPMFASPALAVSAKFQGILVSAYDSLKSAAYSAAATASFSAATAGLVFLQKHLDETATLLPPPPQVPAEDEDAKDYAAALEILCTPATAGAMAVRFPTAGLTPRRAPRFLAAASLHPSSLRAIGASASVDGDGCRGSQDGRRGFPRPQIPRRSSLSSLLLPCRGGPHTALLSPAGAVGGGMAGIGRSFTSASKRNLWLRV